MYLTNLFWISIDIEIHFQRTVMTTLRFLLEKVLADRFLFVTFSTTKYIRSSFGLSPLIYELIYELCREVFYQMCDFNELLWGANNCQILFRTYGQWHVKLKQKVEFKKPNWNWKKCQKFFRTLFTVCLCVFTNHLLCTHY